MSEPIVKVRNLRTGFDIEGKMAWAVRGVSFDIFPGEVLGLVGESGSGKSVTSLSLLRLIPDPPGKIAEGEVFFEGEDLLKLSFPEMRKIRGKKIAMIFQEPMVSLNPLHRIGKQLVETLAIHRGMRTNKAQALAIEWLSKVGIRHPEQKILAYPHELSGGERQRLALARALVLDPKIILLDEPGSNLDMASMERIREMLADLNQQGTGYILASHQQNILSQGCAYNWYLRDQQLITD